MQAECQYLQGASASLSVRGVCQQPGSGQFTTQWGPFESLEGSWLCGADSAELLVRLYTHKCGSWSDNCMCTAFK